eukprot:TRINITY_DN11621_c0_g1_i1.p1 TRINITY_DN11621_c0_g1~~TRINITY_DN11621_c0_g1_i1.p1  ORF type:complete len:582 (+),score=84.91 TRINITY_DN11621_c0_g1_i1:106-1851(+)
MVGERCKHADNSELCETLPGDSVMMQLQMSRPLDWSHSLPGNSKYCMANGATGTSPRLMTLAESGLLTATSTLVPLGEHNIAELASTLPPLSAPPSKMGDISKREGLAATTPLHMASNGCADENDGIVECSSPLRQPPTSGSAERETAFEASPSALVAPAAEDFYTDGETDDEGCGPLGATTRGVGGARRHKVNTTCDSLAFSASSAGGDTIQSLLREGGLRSSTAEELEVSFNLSHGPVRDFGGSCDAKLGDTAQPTVVLSGLSDTEQRTVVLSRLVDTQPGASPSILDDTQRGNSLSRIGETQRRVSPSRLGDTQRPASPSMTFADGTARRILERDLRAALVGADVVTSAAVDNFSPAAVTRNVLATGNGSLPVPVDPNATLAAGTSASATGSAATVAWSAQGLGDTEQRTMMMSSILADGTARRILERDLRAALADDAVDSSTAVGSSPAINKRFAVAATSSSAIVDGKVAATSRGTFAIAMGNSTTSDSPSVIGTATRSYSASSGGAKGGVVRRGETEDVCGCVTPTVSPSQREGQVDQKQLESFAQAVQNARGMEDALRGELLELLQQMPAAKSIC